MQPEFPLDAVNRITKLIHNDALAPSVSEDLKQITEYCWKARSQAARSYALAEHFDADERFLPEHIMDAVRVQVDSMRAALEAVGQRHISGILTQIVTSHENLYKRSRKLFATLFVYADPLSYRQEGEFSKDTSVVEGSAFSSPVPGRLARETLYGDGGVKPEPAHLQLARAA